MARKTSRDITTDLKKTAADARMQLMAVVGATDLAAERVRKASEKARQTAKEFKIKDLQKDLEKAQRRLDKTQKDLLQRASEAFKEIQDAPNHALGSSLTLASKAQAQVDFGGETGMKWFLLRFAPLTKL